CGHRARGRRRPRRCRVGAPGTPGGQRPGRGRTDPARGHPTHLPGPPLRRVSGRPGTKSRHATFDPRDPGNSKAMTLGDPLTVLCWHVHGGWTDSFVRGPHRYLLPTTGPDDPWARGRCGRRWPRTEEVPVDRLGRTSVDLMVLQRPEEIELARRWTGRMPGVDVPAVYVEHNTPTGHAAGTRHPLADQDRIPVVHVTGFNALMWDCGRAPTTVIAHGVADPGYRYRGELPHAAVVSNEPVRRARIVGADLIGGFAETAPVDVFG